MRKITLKFLSLRRSIIASLRNHDGSGNCNAMLLLFQDFRFKRFLVFCLNLLPLRDSEVVHFNFTTWKPHFCRSVLQIKASKVKVSRFKCSSSNKKDGFQASLSYKRPQFGLFDEMLRVAYGNNSCFANIR